MERGDCPAFGPTMLEPFGTKLWRKTNLERFARGISSKAIKKIGHLDADRDYSPADQRRGILGTVLYGEAGMAAVQGCRLRPVRLPLTMCIHTHTHAHTRTHTHT